MWGLIYGKEDGKNPTVPGAAPATAPVPAPATTAPSPTAKNTVIDEKEEVVKLTRTNSSQDQKKEEKEQSDVTQEQPIKQETADGTTTHSPSDGKEPKEVKEPAKPTPIPQLDRAIAEEEKILKDLEFYHGFLPREDLSYILRSDGDYILRVSEVQASSESNRQAIQTAGHIPKREIILSVMTEVHNCSTPHVHSSDPNGKAVDVGSVVDHQQHDQKVGYLLRNVVVRRTGGKYSVESQRLFETVKDLVQYYASTPQNPLRLSLKNPVKLQSWEFCHSAVKLGAILGEGAYGEVRQGVLNRKNRNYDVAVKLTKGAGDLCKAKIREMMKEARLMRNFKHKHIVRLYGVAVDEQPLYILLELVKGGALNKYLQTKGASVTTKERLLMCLGAAQGLEYLHDKKCIHRDIAARNCLYSVDKVIKISDFGLSRLGNMYKLNAATKLPIKWLAPETIMTLQFTLKTDVFSYGVLCFEIFTNGDEPWDGITNTEAKRNLVSGKHLTLPDLCPEKLRIFIYEKIYVKESQKRVSMVDVVRYLDAAMMDVDVVEEREQTKQEKSQMQQSVIQMAVSTSVEPTVPLSSTPSPSTASAKQGSVDRTRKGKTSKKKAVINTIRPTKFT